MAHGNDKKRLQELRSSGYEMVKGQPNIIGWLIVNADGHKLGKVQELIIDTVAQRVRYLVAALSDNKVLQIDKRTVMLPIGMAQLHPADDCVVISGVTPYQLRALPRYDKANLGPRSEIDISQVFGRAHTALGTTPGGEELDQRFYDHEHFNDQRMSRPSRSDAGERSPRYRPEREEVPASGRNQQDFSSTHLPDDPESIRRRQEQNLRDEEDALRRGLL